MSRDTSSSADTKPGAPPAGNSSQLATPDAIRVFLAAPGAPDAEELGKFRALAEVQAGFEQMQRNFQTAAADPETFNKYKEGWNAICDLLEEVRALRVRTAELEAENDIILDLVQEVGDLKCEVARLEEENKSLAQDNAQMRDNLNSKLSAIDTWIRMERSRARAEALHEAVAADSVDGTEDL